MSEITLANRAFTQRPGTIDDVSAMVLVEDQAIAKREGQDTPVNIVSDYEVERLQKAMRQPATWSNLVYEKENLAGFIFGYPTKDPDTGEVIPNREHISLLMVHPNYWSIGIGGYLLDWVCNEMSQRGKEAISLWTETDNSRSRPLYERKGFQLTGKTRICPDPMRPDPQVMYLKNLETSHEI